MKNIEVIQGDLRKKNDAEAMLKMLDAYMHDPMGGEQSLKDEIARKNIEGLQNQANYVFFLAYYNGSLAGLANCFINFSTFKAKQLINIHDFAVDVKFRRKGIGEAMMNRIVDYCNTNDMCKITLEVRHDNLGAQNLYRKMGFVECEPAMYFWEKEV